MQADSYLALLADNTALVKSGRVELGQGSTTGLLLLAAEELDMDVGQLVFARQDTDVTPDTGGTFGSSSIAQAGQRLRAACARGAARRCSASPRRELGVPVANLTVSSGVVSGGGSSVSYGELLGGRLIAARAPAPRSSIRASRRRSPSPPTDSPASRSAARRHPRQGRRHLRLHPLGPRSRDAARADRPPARSGRLRRRHA